MAVWVQVGVVPGCIGSSLDEVHIETTKRAKHEQENRAASGHGTLENGAVQVGTRYRSLQLAGNRQDNEAAKVVTFIVIGPNVGKASHVPSPFYHRPVAAKTTLPTTTPAIATSSNTVPQQDRASTQATSNDGEAARRQGDNGKTATTTSRPWARQRRRSTTLTAAPARRCSDDDEVILFTMMGRQWRRSDNDHDDIDIGSPSHSMTRTRTIHATSSLVSSISPLTSYTHTHTFSGFTQGSGFRFGVQRRLSPNRTKTGPDLQEVQCAQARARKHARIAHALAWLSLLLLPKPEPTVAAPNAQGVELVEGDGMQDDVEEFCVRWSARCCRRHITRSHLNLK
ncbi:hypothetical protein EDB85DRAFT_1896497 [Lactarius pseudohatsudake]|nr:hypothetical protein EDB85DRAFT_1896497 [Lactarius pseudohatsudake]